MTTRPGRVLDVGAGEGADAIRFAKLGYEVDAIELSSVACEKMERFSREEQVSLNIRNESILTAELSEGAYDFVVMNGLLHYVADKSELLAKLRRASAPSSVHVVSIFSTATPLPPQHSAIPVFPESEAGSVERFYQEDDVRWMMYDRQKLETSHPGFAEHSHSFIKLIIRLSNDPIGV